MAERTDAFPDDDPPIPLGVVCIELVRAPVLPARTWRTFFTRPTPGGKASRFDAPGRTRAVRRP